MSRNDTKLDKTVRGTTATRKATDDEGNACAVVDCWKLLKTYRDVPNIPEKFGFARASELAMACRWVCAIIEQKLDYTPPKGN